MSVLKQVILTAAVLAGCGSTGCTPAERQKLGVPVLSQADAIGSTLAQAVGWCQEHDAPPGDVLQALKDIADKHPELAIDVTRRMLQASAAHGERVPPEVVGLVQTAEYAVAAQAVQDGMRALAR